MQKKYTHLKHDGRRHEQCAANFVHVVYVVVAALSSLEGGGAPHGSVVVASAQKPVFCDKVTSRQHQLVYVRPTAIVGTYQHQLLKQYRKTRPGVDGPIQHTW